jgi:hypothetical protein
MLVTNSFKVLWEFAAVGLGYIMTARSVALKGAAIQSIGGIAAGQSHPEQIAAFPSSPQPERTFPRWLTACCGMW